MDCIKRQAGWLTSTLLFFGSTAIGQIRVPRLVGDGMVLQRDMPIHIWGFGSPGEQVTVKFDGTTASDITTDNGTWVVVLPPRKAGGPYSMDIDGINHIFLKNIMVGEVWICSGGLPMQQQLGALKEKYADLIAKADAAPIHEYKVGTHYDFKGPRQNLSSGSWESASPASVLTFSELSYLFALRIYDRYHVPVGVIDAAVADAPAQAWLSPDALKLFPEYATLAGDYADSSYPIGISPANRMAPGGLFNGMIAPTDLYTVRGILWCQGESNANKPGDYRRVFSTLISDWRTQRVEGSLPWIYAQLGPHGAVVEEPAESNRAELREAQRLTLTVPVTGMAVAADLGERTDGDISNKEELASRLFAAAEHTAYQKGDVIYSGPIFHSIRIKHDRVTIGFEEVQSGLIVKGGGELRGFALAGVDNHFYWARAVIEGEKVQVTCDQVPNPVAVRYGWADNPDRANLINRDHLFQDGLPAPPFEARKIAK
jgi:sialate O-acetylesterase